jgi:DNA-binding MurR/RpiR family transcriptional regulator
MNFEERIHRDRLNMSKSFARLADFLVDSYTEASFMTASELAHALNLDAATVVRFAQALGYTGFPQLQREIRLKVKNDLLIRPRQAEDDQSVAGIATYALRELSKELEQMRITLDTAALDALVEQINAARRILIIYDPPAWAAAEDLAYALEQGAFLVDRASPHEADLARLLATATSADLLLAVEVQGKTPSIARALAEAQANAVPTAALVCAASLPATRSANIVLAAHAHNSAASSAILAHILVYVLAHTLHTRCVERFAQAEKTAAQIITHLQQAVP